MAKRSAGSFQSIEEVASQVESMEQSGFSRRDITVVSLDRNKDSIQNLTDVEIVTVNEKQKISDELLYGLDEETIKLYNTTVHQGGYVILLDGDAGAEANEGTLDTENQPIASPGAGNVPPPGFGVDPRTPPSLNSDMHGDPMKDTGDTPISDDRNPHVDAGREDRSQRSGESVSPVDSNEESVLDRDDDVLPELTNDDGPQTDQSNITVRPIKNSNTPHSANPEEQTDIPNESLDEDRGSYS